MDSDSVEADITSLKGLMVLEVGLPITLNIYCFYCLFIRCVRIIRAGLLYNTETPDRLIFKRIFMWTWILSTIGQIVGLYWKNHLNEFYWIQ